MSTILFSLLTPLLLQGCGTRADSGEPATEYVRNCEIAEPTGASSSALVFEGARPSNVLMVSIDTLRLSRMGRYGGAADATPFLDQLMTEGLTLDEHQACAPWTYPGLLCALSGRTTPELGFIPSFWKSLPGIFPDHLELLADWLSAEGYATGLVSANSFLSEVAGLEGGYDEAVLLNDGRASEIVSQGLETLATIRASNRDAPWFLHLHIYDPHLRYWPSDNYREEADALDPIPWDLSTDEGIETMMGAWDNLGTGMQELILAHLEALYDGELRHVDDSISVLISTLEAEGLLDDTLVVFWSDHGEQFFEHGALGHGKSLFSGELDALGVFWMANGGIRAQSWTGPTDQRDLVPTIFDALGLAERRDWTGLPVGRAHVDRVRFGLRPYGPYSEQSALRDGLKFIYRWSGEHALYDLGRDVRELEDISADGAEDMACLWEAMKIQSQKIAEIWPEFEDMATAGP